MPLTGAGRILRANGHPCNAGATPTECITTEPNDETTMTLKDDIEGVIGDPAGLERLYRNAQAE